jgi:hypothetical protein
LDPTTKIGYSRKPNPWFKRGTLFRGAVEVLRTAERPLKTREIVEAMLARRGIKVDMFTFADLVKSVERSLRYHWGRGISAVGSRPVHWKLAD